jgi:hypothetical protein
MHKRPLNFYNGSLLGDPHMADKAAVEEGKRRSQAAKNNRKALAIEKYCFQCRQEKVCNARKWGFKSCLFYPHRNGDGVVGATTFKRFCSMCKTAHNMMLEHCNVYSCSINAFSPPKSKAEIMRDMDRKVAGHARGIQDLSEDEDIEGVENIETTADNSPQPGNPALNGKDVSDEIVEGVSPIK